MTYRFTKLITGAPLPLDDGARTGAGRHAEGSVKPKQLAFMDEYLKSATGVHPRRIKPERAWVRYPGTPCPKTRDADPPHSRSHFAS